MAQGIACGSFVLVSYTFIAAICSLSFFSLGIFAQISISSYYKIGSLVPDHFNSTSLTSLLWILVTLSGITALMAFACSCCCLRSKGCGIFCVALIVTAALIGEQVVIQKCYSGQNEALKQVETNLNLTLPQYHNKIEILHFWNVLQTGRQCCGLHGPEDWNNVLENNNTLPASCCIQDKTTSEVADCTIDAANVYREGCAPKVMSTLRDNFMAIYAITMFIFALEILTIVVGLCACCCLGPTRIIFDSKFLSM